MRGLLFAVLLFTSISRLFALDATYYDDSFEWKRTANGDIFSQDSFSAAICGIPLGSYAYVSSANTWVVVTLNDRPNCKKHEDIVDLSRVAFEPFASFSKGRISDISIVPIASEKFLQKKIYASTVFQEQNVILKQRFANTYFADESILLQGRVTDGKKNVIIYLSRKDTGEEFTFLAETDSAGNFSYPLSFPSLQWEYYFVIASGNSFSGVRPISLYLFSSTEFSYPAFTTSGSIAFSPKIFSNQTHSYMLLPDNFWWVLTIEQDGRIFSSTWTVIVPETTGIRAWKAQAHITWNFLSTTSPLDKNPISYTLWDSPVMLGRTHDAYGKNKVSTRILKNSVLFRFRLKEEDRIRAKYYVTLPSGDVREYDFPKNFVNKDTGLLKTGIMINANFPLIEFGTYKLETVTDKGFAYFNLPINKWTVWNIINPLSYDEIVTIKNQRFTVERDIIAEINRIRAWLWRPLVSIDTILTNLAQAKANDMAINWYVWHWTKEWKDIVEFGKALWFSLSGSIAENVAGGNVSHLALQDGLEESWTHRHAMVDPTWTKIGIWYTVKDGKSYLVELFSE